MELWLFLILFTVLSVIIRKKKNLCVAVWLFGHYLSQLAGPNIFSVSVTIPLPSPISHMPCCKVSRDLKARIPALFHQHGFKVKEICGILDVKKSVVYQTLSFAGAYGVSYNPFANKSGRKRLLSIGDMKFIVALLTSRHSMYLDEIQDQLLIERGTSACIATLQMTLHRLSYSHKVVSARALERNNLLRSMFMNKIANKVTNPNMLMFVDEAARSKRTSARAKGWSLVGRRCVQRRCFGCGQRFSILPILTLDGIITYDIISRSVTSAWFLQFLHKLVVCSLFHFAWNKTNMMYTVDPPLQSLPRSSKRPRSGQLQHPSLGRCAHTCWRWRRYVHVLESCCVTNSLLIFA